MFKSKNIENIPGQLTPVLLYNNKTHIKVGIKGSTLHRHVSMTYGC